MLEARITPLGRLILGAGQMVPHGRWRLDRVLLEDRARFGEARRIGDGGARGNRSEVVAGNIRNDQRDDLGGRGSRGQAPTLDGGKMFPDAVELGDRRA